MFYKYLLILCILSDEKDCTKYTPTIEIHIDASKQLNIPETTAQANISNCVFASGLSEDEIEHIKEEAMRGAYEGMKKSKWFEY